ncbi:MAG: TonB-dependent receptor plug domain-containing protein [Gammaproteobacteria bacterium]|nr:TonB-dependent receptor plug domain-containing protein [Gammaproteobacteria bacterium]
MNPKTILEIPGEPCDDSNCANDSPGAQKRLLSAMLCIAGAVSAPAQSQVPEEYYFDDLPIVLSVTRLKQSLADTPASMTIIDKDMIRASGAMNIPDLLRHVPGFQVAFVTGKRASVTAHGRGDEYARDMQVTIDGRSIYDPAFGGVSWQDIGLDVDDIQRIEVVRGTNAGSYGSNSFAGVVNIITEHPAQQQGLLLKTRFGTGQNRQHYGRFADSAGKFDFRITASRSEDDGFDTRHDSASTNSFSFRGDYRADSENSFALQLGHSSGPREEGLTGSDEQPLREAYHINHYQQLRWNRQISSEEEFHLQLYHNYQKKDDHFESDVPGLGVLALGYGFDSHRYDLELQYTNRLSEQLRVVSGFGGRYESAEGVWTFGEEKQTRGQLRAFSNVEWTPQPHTVLNFGAMYEAYEGKRGLFSPRFAINQHLDTFNTLRFVAARAYRMPTLFEDNSRVYIYRASDMLPLDYFFLTQDDLEPEQITALELGYLGKFPEQGLTLDIRLFSERIRDIIPNIEDELVLGPVPIPPLDGSQSYVNDGSVVISGLELDLKFRPVPHSLIHFGYGLANANGEQLKRVRRNGPLQYLDLQESVPEQTFSLLGSYRFENGLEISSAFHYVDPMEWLYDGHFVPVRKRWDVRIGKRFRESNADIDLELIAQNIDGNEIQFYNFIDRVDPWVNISDRRIFLQARVNFH